MILWTSLNITVVMKDDAIGLQEVIVTGYGKTVTKDKLTAAISKVSSEVLEKGVRSNPLTALAGTVTCYADFRSAGSRALHSGTCRCFFERFR